MQKSSNQSFQQLIDNPSKRGAEFYSELAGKLAEGGDVATTKNIYKVVDLILKDDTIPNQHEKSHAFENIMVAYLQGNKIKHANFELFDFKQPSHISDKAAEFVIKTANNLGESSSFLTSALYKFFSQVYSETSLDQSKDAQILQKRILSAYLENNKVSYDEFKNLLTTNKIDDFQIKLDLFKSYTKGNQINTDIELKDIAGDFFKNINIFDIDKNIHTATVKIDNAKRDFLKDYLIEKGQTLNEEQLQNHASALDLKLVKQTWADLPPLMIAERMERDYPDTVLGKMLKEVNREIESRASGAPSSSPQSPSSPSRPGANYQR